MIFLILSWNTSLTLLSNVYQLLQDSATDYLIHRYVSCDKVYWRKFMDETVNCILILDFSQNIALASKQDTQSGYYSGKQQTLHDYYSEARWV